MAIFWLTWRFKAKADTAQPEECNAMTSRLAYLYRFPVICFTFDKATTTNGVIEFPAAADAAVAVEADAKSAGGDCWCCLRLCLSCCCCLCCQSNWRTSRRMTSTAAASESSNNCQGRRQGLCSHAVTLMTPFCNQSAKLHCKKCFV